MATYATDLSTVDLCESSGASLYEFSGWAAGDVSGPGDTDYFIQGTACHTGAQKSKTGMQSIAIDYGSDLGGSLSSGDCIFMWQVLLAGNAIDTWDNGGYRMGIGTSTSAFWGWITGGSDFNRNPYGGWQNVAVLPDLQNAAVQIDVNSTNGTFTRASGDFTTDGFEVDMPVYGQNFANSGNNARFFIQSVTSTVITVTDNTGMVTETGSGDEVLYMCDYITGTPTTHQYFGSGANMLSAIAKGNLHGLDAIRYGRGEIQVTGTSATFSGMAQENDYNDVTNGYNRWGLFQEISGGYLWKGLMSLGLTGTSVTFSDSDKSISIEDTPRTYRAFNKIEINNTSSSVTWTRVNFTAVSSSQLSPGDFEIVDNATTVDINSCAFTDMGTFIFQSNATIDDSTFLRCDQITHGGADFNNCIFSGYEGDTGTAYMTYAINADPDGEIDDCSFTKGTATTHAIEFDATNTPTTITLRGIDFSGYNASNGQNDSTLYFPSTTKSYTVNLVGCSGNISYRVGSGGSVTLVSNPVTFLVTVRDSSTKAAISGARVLVWVSDGTNYPYNASVSITSSGTTATVTHTTHGLSTNDNVVISGANEECYNGAYQITVSDVDTYTYTMAESGDSPATGTITSTFAVINTTTDGSGQASDSRTYSTDQDVEGWCRYHSDPYYKSSDIDEIIDNTDGRSITVYMISDE